MTTARLLCLLAFVPVLGAWNPTRIANRAVAEGNTLLQNGKAEEALRAYDRAAQELPGDPGVHFDRGVALSALGKHEDAVLAFLRATEGAPTTLKAQAFYNVGNALFRSNKFGEAVEAYKRSLSFDPKNVDAKWNLELALKKKREEDKNKQDKQDKQDKQKNEDDKKDDKQDDQKNPDQKPDGKQDPKQDQQQGPKQDPKPDQKPDPKQGDQKNDDKNQDRQDQPKPEAGKDQRAPDMREMDSILDGLERSPKSLEQVRARARAVRGTPVKDW